MKGLIAMCISANHLMQLDLRRAQKKTNCEASFLAGCKKNHLEKKTNVVLLVATFKV